MFRFICELSFDTCSEFRWNSLADNLDFKKPTLSSKVFPTVIIRAVLNICLQPMALQRMSLIIIIIIIIIITV